MARFSLARSRPGQRISPGGNHGLAIAAMPSATAAQLRRDPRASIVVCEPTPPYRGVEVRCHARLLTAGARDAVRRIASRYLGAEGGAAYAQSAGDDLLIRLEPGDLRAWDFADEFCLCAEIVDGPGPMSALARSPGRPRKRAAGL